MLLPDALQKYLEAFELAVAATSGRAPLGIREAWRTDVERLAAAIRDGKEFTPYCEGD